MSLVKLRDVTKVYEVDPPIHALDGVNLDVVQGEKLAIIGRSGAGKSTLLNILGLLDVPTSGEYFLDGVSVGDLTEKKRDSFRALSLGFVFQDFHVLAHRSVYDNLDLKLSIARVAPADRHSIIEGVLDVVGLQDRTSSLTRLLSGGEKQRLAIARAIINSPQLILADEPTGNLDGDNARRVLELFDMQAQRGVAIIVITHDDRLSGWADRVITLDRGRLHE